MSALGILGRKLGMIQFFDEEGRALAATVIEASPSVVVQVKRAERDGYNAIQLGWGEQKESRLTKPLAGHFKRAEVAPRRVLREFRVPDPEQFKPGQELGVELFAAGEEIVVSGRSRGKGFQGVMKRHGFAGGPKSHGSNFRRRPGSIGTIRGTGRVFKGQRMAGRTGNERITIKGIKVLKVDPERRLIVVRGAVPGAKGGVLELRKAHGEG
ncbi:MAG: 50S ribosomal protein L3 [Candidatus Acetothermia bacterium]|jgi:large subunit ribosomal protein L3|nr:50S ribosomal protein L3 [Candidatus Acetothermia bacterium]MDH7505553.1 50S ribosomal protein L3 [Candidatus Acetothermia bacterium]